MSRARLGWEAVLAVLALVATAVAVAQGHFFTASGPWPQVAVTGFVAAALALSLRTGTPNLAVASMASLAQLLYVLLADRNLPAPAAGAVAVLAVAGLGLVLAGIVGVTGLPAWAVSFAGVAVCDIVAFARGANVQVLGSGMAGAGVLDAFAAVFVLGSVAAGLLWLRPGVRSRLGPGAGRPFLPAVAGLGGSGLLAGIAGVLLAAYTGAAGFTGDTTQLLTALGAVLLGGISLAGRGGGVAGTALGVYLLSTVGFAGATHGGPVWWRVLVPALLAILVGLAACWLLDRVAGSTHAASTTGPDRPRIERRDPGRGGVLADDG